LADIDEGFREKDDEDAEKGGETGSGDEGATEGGEEEHEDNQSGYRWLLLIRCVCQEFNYNFEEVLRLPVVDFFSLIKFINAYNRKYEAARRQAELKMRHGR
jgi:hypothetical protein